MTKLQTSETTTQLPGSNEAASRSTEIQDPLALSEAFDLEAAMEFTGGNRELLGELVNSMLEETPRLMDRISQAIEQTDREELRFAAHTLKGSVAMVGANKASDAAALLESVGTDDDLTSAGPLHAELKSRIDMLLDALELQSGKLRDS